MTNAEKILLTVDRHLTTSVDITLYGRAAIATDAQLIIRAAGYGEADVRQMTGRGQTSLKSLFKGIRVSVGRPRNTLHRHS